MTLDEALAEYRAAAKDMPLHSEVIFMDVLQRKQRRLNLAINALLEAALLPTTAQ